MEIFLCGWIKERQNKVKTIKVHKVFMAFSIYFILLFHWYNTKLHLHISVEVSWLKAIKWNGDTLFQLANTMCTLHWLEYAECIKLQFYFWYDLRLTWDQQGNGSSYVLFLIILAGRSEISYLLLFAANTKITHWQHEPWKRFSICRE